MKELVSDESIEKYKKINASSTNDTIKTFINNINTKVVPVKNKKLALASNLLNNIDELYKTFPHFEEVIDHIKNIMILQEKGDKTFYIPPLLLGGGPGVGKTFFCNTLSKLVNTHFEMISMESVSANFILTGSSAFWSNGSTGKIYDVLMNPDIETMNPIFLLDEIEKAGGDHRYSVINSLLPLLERYTAQKYKDECISLEIDASYIIWLATANEIDKLSAPIRSRFDIISIPNPTPIQRKSLIGGIYKSIRQNNSWGNYFSEILPEESLDLLAMLMAPGAARDLRKTITLACSKAIVDNSNIILPKHIESYDTGQIMPWDQHKM